MEASKERPFDCIIKKAVFLRVGELTSEFKSGCAVVDVLFPGTEVVNIGRINFQNNYSASVEIKMKVHDADSNEVWKQCIKKTKLMPKAHYEAGSQSYFIFTTQEMCNPTDKVIMLRIILRQPSPHWASFGIEDLKSFPPTSLSLTSSPVWLGLDDEKDTQATTKQLLQVLPEPDQVSQSMQQMWAMVEEIKSSKPERVMGRFDVDGSYDINLLSYT